MESNKKIHYQLEHFYPGLDRKKLWDLFVDPVAWTNSTFLGGEITILKPGKGHPQGLGAVRSLKSGRMTIVEDIVGFKPNKYFSYATHNGSLPVNDFGGQVYFESKDGGVLLKYKGGFNPKFLGTGWFFKRFLSSGQKSVLADLEKEYKTFYKS